MKYLILVLFLIITVVIYSFQIRDNIRKMEAESSEHQKDELELNVFGNVICLFAMPVLIIGFFEYLTLRNII